MNDSAGKLQEDLAQGQNGELTGFDQEVLENLARLEGEIVEALSDDSNTAMAMGVLFDLVREINAYRHKRGVHSQVLQKAWDVLKLWAGDILGILQLEQGRLDGLTDASWSCSFLTEELRRRRNFALADRIRDGLAELGVVVEDTPQGPRWKV